MSAHGKVALITGGSRGIGRAVVRSLANDGYSVAFSYRKEEQAAAKLVRELAGLGVAGLALQADLRVPGSAAGLAERAAAELGPVSALVNNAGVASRGRTAVGTPDDEYLDLYRVHVLSAVEAARAVLPGMRKRGSGAIVFVSSTYAALRPAGSAPYVAAKSALEAVSGVMAREERPHGVRVNVVAPGLVATDMGDRLVRASSGHGAASDLDEQAPFGRICRPEDVAEAIRFLVGPGSSYVTGARLVVDGGEAP